MEVGGMDSTGHALRVDKRGRQGLSCCVYLLLRVSLNCAVNYMLLFDFPLN